MSQRPGGVKADGRLCPASDAERANKNGDLGKAAVFIAAKTPRAI